MKGLWIFGIIMIFFITGCSEDVLLLNQGNSFITTINGTSYNPSQTFDLPDRCSSVSQVVNSNFSLLSCSSGVLTDTSLNAQGNWTGTCCVPISSVCQTFTIQNITPSGLDLRSGHIYNIIDDGIGFIAWCGNALGGQLYSEYLNSSQDACSRGYIEKYINVDYVGSNNWNVTSCYAGFN